MLKGERDAHADALAAGVVRAPVGSLHEAGPPTGTHVDAGRGVLAGRKGGLSAGGGCWGWELAGR
jgi:hypothetical protein